MLRPSTLLRARNDIIGLAIAVTLLLSSTNSNAQSSTRFFYSGNGNISLQSAHTKTSFSGTYRNPDGTYREDAIKKINRVFGILPSPPVDEGRETRDERRIPPSPRLRRAGVHRPSSIVHRSQGEGRIISLRLIEFLDYLQDKFGGKTLVLVSGYRSPEYNTSLRENGALAGKASLHQYGMATDFRMAGVSSKAIWEYVRDLKFGGAGYYHGKNVHIDVGPARWWDEATSKVGTDIADENKLIMLVTDRDIYKSGETINLGFARMTAWPIGVEPEFVIEKVDEGRRTTDERRDVFRPSSLVPRAQDERCHIFNDWKPMLNMPWQIPSDLPAGRYLIRAKFCEKQWDAMPAEITTNEFMVTSD